MEKYSKYKDSGVKWIGDVPKHWDIKRLGLFFTENRTINSDMQCTEAYKFNYGTLIRKDEDIDPNELKDTYSKYTALKPRDIVINGLNLNYDFVSQRVALATSNGIITSAYIVISPRTKVNELFFYYLLKSMDAMKLFHGMGSGIRLTLSFKDLKYQLIPIPPLAEQRAIVSYLDSKVGQIDTYVAKQTQQIELLKELKQAVIANAVTKGIDNKAKLKQTGISWIGHVPQHWEQCRLKNVVSCNNETLSNNTEPSLQIEYVEIADVKEMEGIVRTTHYKFSEAPSRARRITKNGDIILSTVRTYLKAVALVKQEGLIVSTGFAVLRPNDCNQEYISYLLRSDYFLGEVSRRSFGISYPSITTDALLSIEIPIPPLPEQLAIVSYIEGQTSNIDKLINAYQQQVERIKEYKQRLITDAVTGKINVTGKQTQTN